jgi:hypothetical protein
MEKINLQKLASHIQAYKNCIESNNKEWGVKHLEKIEFFNDLLPHGSGLDNGMKINIQDSTPLKIVISFSYHHLNEGGFYDGWTDHVLIITPCFGGFDMKITGRDKNQVKEYLYQTFDEYFI